MGIVVAAAGLAACARGSDPTPAPAQRTSAAPSAQEAAATVSEEVNPRLLRRFQPLKDAISADGVELTEARIDLGRHLFHEKRISRGKDVSCNSCHERSKYGVDNEITSVGFEKQRGGRNSPAVYNAAGYFAQFWDGRAATVEEQAKGPLVNPREMAMPDGATVASTLRAIPGYRAAFAKAFPGEADPITYDNVGRAIGAFERKLVTPGRWDKYLEGDKSALTHAEKEGLKTFLNVGCMVCHTGAYLGGSMYERVGVVEPWPNQDDQGRFGVTRVEGDKMMFKVPSLRNVEKTAPYFHDGSVATLKDAVRMMGKHQLGLDLAEEEIGSIVTWLKSLTGKLPADYIAPPIPY